MMPEIGDVNEIPELQEKARTRGREAVKKFLTGLGKKYKAGVRVLDDRIVVSPQVKKINLIEDQRRLKDRVTTENLETRKSIILLNKKMERIGALKSALRVSRSLEQDPFQQVMIDGRIKVAEERLAKMTLVRTSLEEILAGLNKAMVDLRDTVFLESIVPISADLDDLFSEIDRAQLESERLAGMVEEKEAEVEALKELEEIGDLEE